MKPLVTKFYNLLPEMHYDIYANYWVLSDIPIRNHTLLITTDRDFKHKDRGDLAGCTYKVILKLYKIKNHISDCIMWIL